MIHIVFSKSRDTMRRTWYVYTYTYSRVSAIKNEITSFVGKWMGLEVILLGEISQAHR